MDLTKLVRNKYFLSWLSVVATVAALPVPPTNRCGLVTICRKPYDNLACQVQGSHFAMMLQEPNTIAGNGAAPAGSLAACGRPALGFFMACNLLRRGRGITAMPLAGARRACGP